ncbi:hypothetical protein FQN54_003618 [Arachnomyces sp. PD_36]|nr:hypothetical protein FQN54_003618 [Arachnomyces sp. PD_36]
MALDTARVRSLPETAYYIPEFITKEEEERLLQKITTAPQPRWTQLSHRRLQTWPSALTKSNVLLESPLPPWLTAPIISPHFEQLSIFKNSPHGTPNHVLINEYQPGQGIMPHEDGAAYHPVVATVSLGSPIVLDLYEKKRVEESGVAGEVQGRMVPEYRILQEPRSLLVTTDSLYTDYLHGIAEKEKDEDLGAETICNWELLGEKGRFESGGCMRETRISLTYRDVLKVSKLGNSMKFLGRK